MEIIQIIGAIGGGVIIAKILDIVWLQKVTHESDKRKWIREKRLEAYSELAEEILTLGRHKGSREDIFSGYAIAAKSMLLTESDELSDEIRIFMNSIGNLYKEALKDENDKSKISEEKLEGAYNLLMTQSKKLIMNLRNDIQK